MTFEELAVQLKKLKIDQWRNDSATELEFVVRTEHLKDLWLVLDSYFGPALKPAGSEPTKETEEITSALGGVRRNQTLYYKETNELSSCALIWPWNDGKLSTVKVLRSQ